MNHCQQKQTTIKMNNIIKLEDAIELILKVAKRHAETYDQEDEILEASNVVEDFFVNNVFEDED